MKARPRPLGLFGEVALLYGHPNGTSRTNMQICAYADLLAICLFPQQSAIKTIRHSLFHTNIRLRSPGSHHITAQVFIQTFRGFFVRSVCSLCAVQLACYPIITINILLRSNYSSCSNTFSLPLWNPRIALFFFFFHFEACNLQPPGEYSWPADQSLTKLLILQKRRPAI